MKFYPLILNLLIHLSSFLIVYYYKKQILYINEDYYTFLQIYLGAWFFSGLIAQKFPKKGYETFYETFQHTFSSFFILLGLLSFSLLRFDLVHISRGIVLYTLILAFAIEIIIIFISYRQEIFHNKHLKIQKFFNIYYFISDFILLLIVFAALFVSENDIYNYWSEISWILFFSWLLSSFYAHQFHRNYNQNFFKFIYPFIRSAVFFLSMVIFSLFLFKPEIEIQLQTINYMIFFVSVQILTKTLAYLYLKPSKTDEIAPDYFSADILKTDVLRDEEYFTQEKYDKNGTSRLNQDLKKKLENVYLKSQAPIHHFIEKTVNLDSFDITKSIVIRSSDPYNVKILPDNYMEFFINLHELNDIRRINEYFIYVNKKLQTGGIYIGCFEPIKLRLFRFQRKYPDNIAKVFYFFDFIWKRIMPKLPVLQKFYFAVTNGKDRALSKAEGLGRLAYTGFDILALTEYENLMYFIVKKVRQPKKDKNPSYTPLFKMRRIGRDGKDILVYKFRTMHPYSEYLHQYMIDNYGYSKEGTGRPANDFRITAWGRVLRKYWLDELPQLVNVFKGEMKFIGVRPVSKVRFNEFPKDMQELRIKDKPGCIPPYVALLMKDEKQNIEAERIYLTEREKHPFLTDLKYIWKAIYNILTNKIRSE